MRVLVEEGGRGGVLHKATLNRPPLPSFPNDRYAERDVGATQAMGLSLRPLWYNGPTANVPLMTQPSLIASPVQSSPMFHCQISPFYLLATHTSLPFSFFFLQL